MKQQVKLYEEESEDVCPNIDDVMDADVDETNYDPYSGCDVFETEYIDE